MPESSNEQIKFTLKCSLGDLKYKIIQAVYASFHTLPNQQWF